MADIAENDGRERWGRLPPILLGVGVFLYFLLFSARTISSFTAGTSLFDLATYAQGFWNALDSQPFFYSLEGEMSRFARHFSPFFYLLLPAYWLYPSPITLLALQALIIGLGAVPVYLLALDRIGSRWLGLALGLAYLLNPAVHDINIQNDFHEIAFALPMLLWLFYFGLRREDDRGWRSELLYLVALIVALSTREEVSITTTLFGLYLLVFSKRRTLGLMTIAISLVWLVVVFFVVMPGFNPTGRFPMPDGYSYLGDSPSAIVKGIFDNPGAVIAEVTRREKLVYLFWLVVPLGLLPLLAPEVLLIGGIALLEVLASTYEIHYRVFERYASPIVPVFFLAAIVGAERIFVVARRVGFSRERTASALPIIALLVLCGTGFSQFWLKKLPTEINFTPSAHNARALDLARSIPTELSVASADHRLLPHLADRRLLYPLAPNAPPSDYVFFDRGQMPITHVKPADLRQVEDRLLADSSYSVLHCDQGIFLLGKSEAADRYYGDGFGKSLTEGKGELAQFADVATLIGVQTRLDADRNRLLVTLIWRAEKRPTTEYQVFVHLVRAEQGEAPVAQHDGPPVSGLCPSSVWSARLVLSDEHPIQLSAPIVSDLTASLSPERLSASGYVVRVGLYDLRTLARLPIATSSSANVRRDYYEAPLIIMR